MSGIHNLKPRKVVKAFERAGWINQGQKGSHVKLTSEASEYILSIPVHKGKPIKRGLLLDQIKKAGMTVEEFFRFYSGKS
ncbi:MAG: type II toxin-antitoxin system HicA family toxin [Nitrospinae bacterium]|nr:type II toxin-antitoxin system HicA family toxin [Nitrospinota bacterium]